MFSLKSILFGTSLLLSLISAHPVPQILNVGVGSGDLYTELGQGETVPVVAREAQELSVPVGSGGMWTEVSSKPIGNS
jgi:hypothetical protein